METRRKLSKVGGSVMLPIPPEMLGELALEAGSEVRLSSGDGHIRVDPVSQRPRREVVEFMARFMEEYDADLRSLADR